jgi:hypothetical protein
LLLARQAFLALSGRFGGLQAAKKRYVLADCGGFAATVGQKQESLGRFHLPKPLQDLIDERRRRAICNLQSKRGAAMSVLELARAERIRRDYSAEGMEELFVRLDLLHDYAAAGQLEDVTALSRADLRGWLEELIYTARETLREMEGHHV